MLLPSGAFDFGIKLVPPIYRYRCTVALVLVSKRTNLMTIF